jgi:hypothetical protein
MIEGQRFRTDRSVRIEGVAVAARNADSTDQSNLPMVDAQRRSGRRRCLPKAHFDVEAARPAP